MWTCKYQFEYNHDNIKIGFNELPQLQPHIIQTEGVSWWRRFFNAQRPRKYSIINDWQIQISGLSTNLDGIIVIPKGTNIDGASIPMPWFIAFITLGILRPTGILLLASIPHDYAFDTGQLPYLNPLESKIEYRVVSREQADNLFYQIIKIVNRAPFTAAISWLAVRLGWYWVKYNGQARQGLFPITVTALLLLPFILFVILQCQP